LLPLAPVLLCNPAFGLQRRHKIESAPLRHSQTSFTQDTYQHIGDGMKLGSSKKLSNYYGLICHPTPREAWIIAQSKLPMTYTATWKGRSRNK